MHVALWGYATDDAVSPNNSEVVRFDVVEGDLVLAWLFKWILPSVVGHAGSKLS